MSVRVKLKGSGTLTLEDIHGCQALLSASRSVEVSEETYQRVRNFCVLVMSEWSVVRKDYLRILVPDGIGDIHWIFLKLGSLVEKCGAKGVDLFVRDMSPVRPRRCEEFVKMNPLIRSVCFIRKMIKVPSEGFLVEEDGFDYILDPTDWLLEGNHISDWLPKLGVNFDYLFNYSKPVSIYPDRVIVCFGNEDSERVWGGGWRAKDWAYLVRILSKKFSVWVVGLECDSKYAKKVADSGCVFTNQVGKSSFKEVLDLATTCSLFIGSVSGLVMVAAHLNQTTVGIWPGDSAESPLPVAMRRSWVKDRPSYHTTTFSTGSREVAKYCLQILL